MAWAAGETIGGRYRLERLLGEGGMGSVWAAVHLVTRKAVALKVLKSSYANNKPIIHRFLREARAACAVRHPNVVQIHDVIEIEDGLPVMVMDLLEGESLGQRLLRDQILSLPELAAILGPVVSAVGAAHALGIVHRDLKPDNIFLARASSGTGIEVKVLDFGIAKLTATEGDSAATGGLTGTGAMLGTPYYMAPEQIYGEKDIDQRCDIWAIGVIMYEILAGVRPTQADSVGQILRIVTRDGIKPLRTVRPDLPADVLDFVDRLLETDRAKRPKNMSEVADFLATYVTSGISSAPLATTNPRGTSFVADADLAAAPTIAATLSPGTTTVGKATLASRRAPVIAIAAVALTALATTLFFATRDTRRAGTPNERIEVANDASLASTASSATAPTATATASASASAIPTVAAPTATATVAHRVDGGLKPSGSTAPPPSASAPSAATTHTPGGVVDKPPF